LTPVALESSIYVKREDLFTIREADSIGGSKLRQCLLILDGLPVRRIISAGSIHSPQPSIVAYVAKFLGLPCIILVGGKRETVSLALARRFGADVIRCKSGRHTVLFAKAKGLAEENDFIVPFGMRPTKLSREFYEICASQVSNIPSTIETIVIASGSGVTATAVAYGMWKERRKGQIAMITVGPDRRQQILETLCTLNRASAGWVEEQDIIRVFPLGQDPRFRYETPVQFKLGRIPLHPMYEGKAFSWFFKNVKFSATRTLFWITGPALNL
jgi:1-aminocyclopropane-1-carboxylate deaminase/D-cysteine desulfhydrase-like pyridoxal-dependent ACC family enzyme